MTGTRFLVIAFASIFFSLTSCSPREIYDLKLEGFVLDSISQSPIVGAEILVLAWKYAGPSDVNYKDRIAQTDSNGYFSMAIERTFRIDVGIQHKGYIIAHQSFQKPRNKNISINFELQRVKSETEAIFLDPDIPEEAGLFWGVRNYHADNSQKWEVWGFDMDKKRASSNKKEAEVWIQLAEKDFESSWTLEGQNGWKILPIRFPRLESNLAFTLFEAPKYGYSDTHEVQGTELGYFLTNKDRTEYVKVILSPYKIQGEITSEKGFYEEKIQSFQIVYNNKASRDLYINPEVNLEFFLIALP